MIFLGFLPFFPAIIWLIFNEVPIIGGYSGFKGENCQHKQIIMNFKLKITEKLQLCILKINTKTFISLLSAHVC